MNTPANYGSIPTDSDYTAAGSGSRPPQDDLRAALQHLPIGLAYLTLEGDWIWANRRLCQIFGHTLEELALQNCSENVCLEERRWFLDHQRLLVSGERAQVALEQRCRRKDGSIFWASWALSLERGPNGASDRLAAVVDDISIRKWTEENLLLLGAGIGGSSEAIAVSDAQGRQAYHNGAFSRMFGYGAAELSEPLGQLKLYADQARGREILGATLQGEAWHGDAEMVAKDGRHFPVELRADAIRDERGKIVGLIASHTDVTDRSAAHEALLASEQRFRALFELAPDGIYLTDIEGNFIDGNKAAEKLIGYSREELVGKSFLTLNLLPWAELAKAAGSLARSSRGEPTGPEEFILRPKEGKPVSVEIRTFPVRIGNQALVLGIARDLTERKQLEGQLLQSQKMEAVGQLASGITHDFNNMLAVIQGNVELLMLDADQFSAEARTCLKSVASAAGKAANLTRQLLVFSRKQIMQPSRVEPNDLIREFAKMLARTLPANIEFKCVYGEKLTGVLADPGMLEQVLLNLVVNARDAMPNGGKLQIRTENQNIDAAYARGNPNAVLGEYACLSVSDTGTGIAPEHLSRIYEPFFTTKGPGKGTGLGLAMVYGIVKQHQGWMELSTELGVGTCFKVYLPAVPHAVPAAAAAATPAASLGGTERILLVEDDLAVRAITQQLLEAHGYQVWKADSADSALELWREHEAEVKLLLTDIMMPGALTGRQLAEQLQRERPELKVIFMSGYTPEIAAGQTDFVQRLRACFLQKPCASRTILETVRRSLDETAPQTKGNL